MKEKPVNIVGVGTALVDLKIINPAEALPQSPEEVPEFLSHQNEVKRNAGGSMATAIATIVRLMSPGHVSFLQRIGPDDNGNFYKQQTPIELAADIQIDMVNPTGICIFALTDGPQKIDQWPEVTFYGASDQLEIPKGFGTRGDVFITNINAFKRFLPKGQIVDALQEAAGSGSSFVLRLSGIQHGTDEKFDKKEIDLLLASLPKPPDIIFANSVELQLASGINSVNRAVQYAFPETNLVVITTGADGSLIRFKGNVFKIPPEELSPNDVVDTTGAGDSYMGVMLAALFTKPYSQWTPEFIASCAKIGTYASALVIQSLESRLTESQLMDLRGKILLIGAEYKVVEELADREEERGNPNRYTPIL